MNSVKKKVLQYYITNQTRGREKKTLQIMNQFIFIFIARCLQTKHFQFYTTLKGVSLHIISYIFRKNTSINPIWEQEIPFSKPNITKLYEKQEK